MKQWNTIYESNRKLDEQFQKQYLESEPKFFEKNCLELSVEIGEYINETKCFKYWTTKSMNKEEALEECADVVTMIFCLYNYLHLQEIPVILEIEVDDILLGFNHLLALSTNLMENCTENVLQEMFSYLVKVSEKLGFTQLEIQEACFKKIKKVESRLDSDY